MGIYFVYGEVNSNHFPDFIAIDYQMQDYLSSLLH